MDINLPLILFLAVTISGVIWLVDIAFFQKKRILAISAVDEQFSKLSEQEKENSDAYLEARSVAALEPIAVEYSKSFFPILLLVFVLRSFIVEPFQIPSESMVPTLEVGDFIVVNKFSYGIRLPLIRKKIIDIDDPKRGDVMVFFPPHEKRYFIKRVIGLPGDKIRYTDNVLYLNGEKVNQKFVRAEPAVAEPGFRDACQESGGSYVVVEEFLRPEDPHHMRKCSNPGRLGVDGYWVVPEGHYFMMGDNRDNSSDSRDWKFVPEERIVGKAFAIWMHWDSFLSIPSFSRAGSI